MDAPLRQSPLRLWIGRRRYWLAGTAVVLALAAIAAYFYLAAGLGQSALSYATTRASYGDVTQTVSANGTLNPVIEVNVGSQVSGTVQKLYVDFNSRVRKGQVLLTLDPTLFKAQLAQSKAALDNADANLLLAKTNETRIATLVKSGYETQSDLDQAVANRKVAEAQVELAAAQLQRDQTNLDNSVIRSPVDGVVINRVVDVGQTVAASFQTPTLFVIGQNLHDMQIDVTVDEADVGQIHPGQHSDFTVDAYPDRKFVGTVAAVRLNPTIVQNVVTYDVVVSVDNRDERLLPGMTAYVDVVVLQRRHVLLVPNAALRVHVPGAVGETAAGSALYVLENGRPRRVLVKSGASDGRQTEILSGSLREGDSVIIGFTAAAQAKRGPFQLF